MITRKLFTSTTDWSDLSQIHPTNGPVFVRESISVPQTGSGKARRVAKPVWAYSGVIRLDKGSGQVCKVYEWRFDGPDRGKVYKEWVEIVSNRIIEIIRRDSIDYLVSSWRY